jgi:hypothetical protein
MWIFLRNSFLSLVDDPADPSMLYVRARVKPDINRIFPNAMVVETPRSDYRFRAFISKDEVARRLAELVCEIDYPSFKDSVHGDARHGWYLRVWAVMRAVQDSLYNKRAHPKQGAATKAVGKNKENRDAAR